MAIGGDDVVKSVGRVFEVLELFDARREPLSATDVERALHYPQSSTLALLKSMVRLGYLAFDRLDRTYLPTMRVAALGHWLDAAFHGEGRLAALLEDLGESTSETVCLSCQNDLSMQFTQVRLGTQGLIFSVKPGDLAPLFQSAIGLTALSARPDAAIRKLAQRMNRQVRGTTPKVDPDAVLQRVRRIRAVGHGMGYDLYMSGIGAIAWVLLPDKVPRPIVLSVGGPVARIRAREAQIVKATRAALRRHLGS
jgi:IclR family transcriptional regulator, KDG regulon repressor